MSDPQRLAALEEQLGWLQHELEQLDATIRGQTAAQDRLAQRIERMEQRLARLEQGGDASEPG